MGRLYEADGLGKLRASDLKDAAERFAARLAKLKFGPKAHSFVSHDEVLSRHVSTGQTVSVEAYVGETRYHRCIVGDFTKIHVTLVE